MKVSQAMPSLCEASRTLLHVQQVFWNRSRVAANCFATILLLCFCALGLVSIAYGQSDQVNRHIAELGLKADAMASARRGAALALGDIKDPRAVEPRIAVLKRDLNADVRQAAASALGKIKDPGPLSPS